VSNFAPAVLRILMTAGCKFIRHGKGSHDIWYSPISGRRFPVGHAIKSKHTANGILKQAGLPKAF
jgi:hypothetical protein